jgi:hypothetical protein
VEGTWPITLLTLCLNSSTIWTSSFYASDQYSLAMVAFEWLSGKRPFRGSFGEVMSQHVLASPPHLPATATTNPIAPSLDNNEVSGYALAVVFHII